MKSVLVVFFLSIQSSYSENIELDATDTAFDTIQFYAADGMSWRIKTYAKDQDVHVWSLGQTVDDIVALARENTAKHYGDVLAEGYIIETDNGLDGLRQGLKERGLAPNLEVSRSSPVFWAPEGSLYRTKSTPQ